MRTQEPEREPLETLEVAVAAFDEVIARLREMNERLAGRKPRPELRVLEGGRALDR